MYNYYIKNTHNIYGEGNLKFKIEYLEKNKQNNLDSLGYIKIYILGIRIKKIVIKRREEVDKKININTVLKLVKRKFKPFKKNEILDIVSSLFNSVKINKLNLRLGINFYDPILNAYAIAFVNSLLPILLFKSNKMSLKKNISYITYISDNLLSLDVNTVFSVSIIKNFKIILKIIFKVK